jgi:transcription initiation factor TFIIIB Brf1 subunit/transcription initiation factor TFIIB
MSFVDDMFRQFKESDKKQVKIEENTQHICKNCKQETLIIDSGAFVCTTCGKEEGVIISDNQEWRTFLDSNSKDNSRCGMPSNPLIPNSLSTMVHKNHAIGNLQLQISMSSESRNLLHVYNIIKTIAKSLLISGILADKAYILYTTLTKGIKNLKRGGVRCALMAKCQYVICKEENTDSHICSEKLIEEHKKLSRNQKYKKNESAINFNEGSKLFDDLYFFKKQQKHTTKSKHDFTKPTEPENIIKTVCYTLNMDDTTISHIIYISRYIKKLSLLSSKMPQSIASGCISLFCVEKKYIQYTVKKVSELCMVSVETTNNTCKELSRYKKIIIAKNVKDLYTGKCGDCSPKKQLSKIYKAPVGAFPQEVEIIEENTVKISISRGRPKKDS